MPGRFGRGKSGDGIQDAKINSNQCRDSRIPSPELGLAGCTAAALNSIQHSTVSASTYTRRGVLSHGESPGTVWGPPRLQHHPRRPSSLTRRVLPPSWRRRPTRRVVLPRRGSPGAARRPSPASAASTYSAMCIFANDFKCF